jgi:hypothetical protein
MSSGSLIENYQTVLEPDFEMNYINRWINLILPLKYGSMMHRKKSLMEIRLMMSGLIWLMLIWLPLLVFQLPTIGITYDESRDMVSQGSFDWLRAEDQLREEMEAGKVFQGTTEGLIKFPHTYKFQKHVPGVGRMFVSVVKAFD